MNRRSGMLACLVVLAGISHGFALAQPDAAYPAFAKHEYPVNILCGLSTEGFQEGVVAGDYKTAVNVQNPSLTHSVRMASRLARALPQQTPGALTGFTQADIGPLESVEIECDELRQRLPLPMTSQFRNGFLSLFSDRQLAVTAVYSARNGAGEVRSVDLLNIRGRAACLNGTRGSDGSCRCSKGATGDHCGNVVAERSAPTLLRMRWVGVGRPGDVFRSADDCVSLEIESFTAQDLFLRIEFYGTLNGHSKAMIPALTTLPFASRATHTIERCLRDFEGDGGAADLLDLAFSATLNARATIMAGLDGAGHRLDRIFAPTGYFHVEPVPGATVPYTAVLYDDQARRQSFRGGDYANRLGFVIKGGGIFVGDTHPDALHDQGGPATPPPVGRYLEDR